MVLAGHLGPLIPYSLIAFPNHGTAASQPPSGTGLPGTGTAGGGYLYDNVL